MIRKKLKPSFKRKLTITLLLLSILPMLVLSFFSLYFVNTSDVTSVRSRLDETLNSADRLVTTNFERIADDLDSLAVSSKMVNVLKQDEFTANDRMELNKDFYLLMGKDSAYMSMYLIKPDGTYFGTDTLPDHYQLPDYENWGIFRESKNTNGVFMYPNYSLDETKKNSTSFIRSVVDQKQIIGYIIVDIGSEYIQNLLSIVKGTAFGYIQFVITGNHDEVIYNDFSTNSVSNSLDRMFRYGQVFDRSDATLEQELSGMIAMSQKSQKLNITYLGLIPKAMLEEQGSLLTIIIVILLAIVVIAVSIISWLVGRNISNPVVELANKMSQFTPGAQPIHLMTNREDEVGVIYEQFDLLMDRMYRYHAEDIEKQDLLRKAEIKSLIAQINPHFLYNTFDSIKWKAKLQETDDIVFMVTELGILLKGNMDMSTMFVGVDEEMRLIESYVNIQKIRYGERLSFSISVQDDVRPYVIPKFLFQPLVENAIMHGIEPLGETGGRIEIHAWKVEEYLYFSVYDNGVGSSKTLEELLHDDNRSIGVKNVDRRIKLYYGENYGLRWKSEPHFGTTVIIQIPIQMKGDHHV
ncbi:hypothetical protein A4S06_00860 [Erysipelotrichaceae bacterium MTC7]|nr:hypothetical protein A4S06_00860 [Erysipelotrichaceae bacterium MTC7]